jgi:hypothetical protein
MRCTAGWRASGMLGRTDGVVAIGCHSSAGGCWGGGCRTHVCRVGWTVPGSLRRTDSVASTRCVLVDFGRRLQDTCCRAVCTYMYVCLLVHCMASAPCACCQHMKQGPQHACVDVCVVRNKACAIVRTAQSGRPVRLSLSGCTGQSCCHCSSMSGLVCLLPCSTNKLWMLKPISGMFVLHAHRLSVLCAASWVTVTYNL